MLEVREMSSTKWYITDGINYLLNTGEFGDGDYLQLKYNLLSISFEWYWSTKEAAEVALKSYESGNGVKEEVFSSIEHLCKCDKEHVINFGCKCGGKIMELGKMNYMICTVSPSGGGKSTIAREILENYTEKLQLSGVICSTDDFFLDSEGIYKFDVGLLGVNHKKNQDKVAYYADKRYPKEQKNLIIIDNTNLSIDELSPYVKIGLENDYIIRLVIPPRALEMGVNDFERANTHNVPMEAIKRQFQKFKDYASFGPALAKKFGCEWNLQTESLIKV